MLLNFLGANHEVTGSCHYLQTQDTHVLVDCGMEQGPDLYVNQEIPVTASKIDYVFITHAHIDHSGLLPLLYSHGFRGKVYATKATCQLCDIMLKDSAHIQMFEAEWKNRKAKRSGNEVVEPLYTMEDALAVLELFIPCNYHSVIDVNDRIRIRFVDAGHLLGSSSIEIWMKEEEVEKKIVFSGDIGHIGKPLIREPEFISDADYVVMESTYGDRNHPAAADYAQMLMNVIRTSFLRGGNVVIPAFSVGRTQEMLYFLRKIKTEKLLPEFPDFEVYVDSPLSAAATNIFQKNISEYFDQEAQDLVNQGINPISFDGLFISTTAEESKNINFINHPVVIISASGMCEAGRIRHHLKHNLWRPESTVLFVGYQVEGTLGNILLNGAPKVKLFGEEITVKAQITNMPGISGHADKDHLTEWAAAFTKRPDKYFIVHGEDHVTDHFAEHLRTELGVQAIAPYSGDCYDLETGEIVREGTREFVAKRSKNTNRSVSNVYARLTAASERLQGVIERSQGYPNKDLAKLADQIIAIADKWEKGHDFTE
ncbi:MAG: MBL fold metallo-hydrolase RNA specificity domain-containing protein [Lachnospiraceae bacterium]